MTDHEGLTDRAAREAAIDVARSFVVRAPAGSGKTGLLTQRYLRLLTTVEYPEQVVAVTFTRKAAAEMLSRVTDALTSARDSEGPPEREYEAVTWRLARAALAHANSRGWALLEAPERLRVLTIDALAGGVVARAPLDADVRPAYPLTDDPSEMYRQAVRDALRDAGAEPGPAAALAEVLRALGNDARAVESRLTKMLATRDQWGGREATRGDRAALESGLAALVSGIVAAGRRRLAPADADDLVACLDFAGRELERLAPDAPGVALAGIRELPAAEDLSSWRLIAEALLRRDGHLRKKVNRSNGFPTDADARDGERARGMRDTMHRLLERLAEDRAMPVWLDLVRRLPDPTIGEADRALLEALATLLDYARASLLLVFDERGEADFVERQLEALQVLGRGDAPSDFALTLDHRIAHLLVDEFQDTSFSQHALLERLTAGWDASDGRTLFFVGDPMQSIYRFRQAEVGLFMEIVSRRRFGSVPLQVLELTSNFRSRPELMAWLNANAACFARSEDRGAALEAVHAHASGRAPEWVVAQAEREPSEQSAVRFDLVPDAAGETAEGEAVVAAIRRARACDPAATIGVLGRSRRHLVPVARALADAGLPWRGVDIERLDERQAVLDAMALTRALAQPFDRTAWLAVARAPWCGLTLADLTALAAGADTVEPPASLFEAMGAARVQARLSSDGRLRLQCLVGALAGPVAERGYRPLAARVRSALRALGAATLYRTRADSEFVERYLALLETRAVDESVLTPETLSALVEGHYATARNAAPGAVELMTMHKAKGLEFDVVIVPGLGQKPQRDDRRLIVWYEFMAPAPSGGRRPLTLAAGLNRRPGADTRLYEFIRFHEDVEQAREARRLLYVALTRARESLTLIGKVSHNPKGEASAPAGSFLAMLWDAIDPAAVPADPRAAATKASAAEPARPAHEPNPDFGPTPLERRPLDAVTKITPSPVPTRPEASRDRPEFAWAGRSARLVGTYVHAVLEHLGRSAAAIPDASFIDGRVAALTSDLEAAGLVDGELESAVGALKTALGHLRDDPRARWILSPAHDDARNEWPLSFVETDREQRPALQSIVVDRSFVDASGTRWIIDYKTSIHRGGDRAAFIAEECDRYRGQLERYASAVRRLEDRPIRLGLYFPFLGAWREWAPGGRPAPAELD